MWPITVLVVLAAIVSIAIKKTPVWFRLLVVLAALYVTWFNTSVELVREHHGEMNVGVGQPYYDLTAYLRSLAEQQKYDQLKSALIKMDEHSMEISTVWLSHSDILIFHRLVSELIGTNKTENTTSSSQFQLMNVPLTNSPAR
jgi:hypothetical protein